MDVVELIMAQCLFCCKDVDNPITEINIDACAEQSPSLKSEGSSLLVSFFHSKVHGNHGVPQSLVYILTRIVGMMFAAIQALIIWQCMAILALLLVFL